MRRAAARSRASAAPEPMQNDISHKPVTRSYPNTRAWSLLIEKLRSPPTGQREFQPGFGVGSVRAIHGRIRVQGLQTCFRNSRNSLSVQRRSAISECRSVTAKLACSASRRAPANQPTREVAHAPASPCKKKKRTENGDGAARDRPVPPGQVRTHPRARPKKRSETRARAWRRSPLPRIPTKKTGEKKEK